MIAGIVLLALGAWWLHRQLNDLARATTAPLATSKISARIKAKLLEADRLYKEKQLRLAEKAYLEVLRHSPRNSSAYQRLGMIYAAGKKYDDAIESFLVVTHIKPSASSFYNLGLSYLENGNYIKAIASLQKANIFQPTAFSFVALARAYQQIGELPEALAAQQEAANLDSDPKIQAKLRQLIKLNGDNQDASG